MFLEIQISAKVFLEYFRSEVSRLVPFVPPITVSVGNSSSAFFIDHVTVGTARFNRAANELQIIQPLTLLIVPSAFVSSEVAPPTEQVSNIDFEMIFALNVGFANTTPQLEVSYTGNIQNATVGEPLVDFLPFVPGFDVQSEIKKKLEGLGNFKVAQEIKIDDATASLLNLPNSAADQILVDVDTAATTFAVRMIFPPAGPTFDAFGTGDFHSFLSDGGHDFAAVVEAGNIISTANARIQQTFNEQGIVLRDDSLGPSWIGADNHVKLGYEVSVTKKDACDDAFGFSHDADLTLTMNLTLDFAGDNVLQTVVVHDYETDPISWLVCASGFFNPANILRGLASKVLSAFHPECTTIDEHTDRCIQTISAPHVLGTLTFQMLRGTSNSAAFLGKLDLGTLVSVPTITDLHTTAFHITLTGSCQHSDFIFRPRAAVIVDTGPTAPGTVPAPVQVGDIIFQTTAGESVPADDFSVKIKIVSKTEVGVIVTYMGDTPPEKNLVVIIPTNAGIRKVNLGKIELPTNTLDQLVALGEAKASCIQTKNDYHGINGGYDPHWTPDPPPDFERDLLRHEDGMTLWQVQVVDETPGVRLQLEQEDGTPLSDATVNSSGIAILSGLVQVMDYGSGVRIRNLDAPRVLATGSIALTRMHLLRLGTIDLKENVRSIELYRGGSGLRLRAYHAQGASVVSLQRPDRPVRVSRSGLSAISARRTEQTEGDLEQREEIVMRQGHTARISADRVELLGQKTAAEFSLKQGERVFRTASAPVASSLYVRRSDGGGTLLRAGENGIEAIAQFPRDPWFMLAQWHGDMLVISDQEGRVNVFRAVSQRREVFPESRTSRDATKDEIAAENILCRLWRIIRVWIARVFGRKQ